MDERYRYWADALRLTDGKRQLTRQEMASLGVSEDNIGCGFFRKRAVPRGPFIDAVAIWAQAVEWEDDGKEWTAQEMFALVNDVGVDPSEVWLHACKYPVHESSYRDWQDHGVWMDDVLPPRPKKCAECGVNYADPPSKLCPGCQAYREHQR